MRGLSVSLARATFSASSAAPGGAGGSELTVGCSEGGWSCSSRLILGPLTSSWLLRGSV